MKDPKRAAKALAAARGTLGRREFAALTLLGAGLSLGPGLSLGQEAGEPSAKPPTDFFEVLLTRRSVRKFKPTPVPDEAIKKILDCARLAPTAGNQQPWKFLVVRDREKLNKLKEACIVRRAEHLAKESNLPKAEVEAMTKRLPKYYEDFLSAPVYVIVLTDSRSEHAEYNAQDGPVAAGYLLLAARALGYGTVYTTDSIPEEITREVFKIPDRYKRVCITPIGVPDAWPERPAKKSLEEFIAYETIV